MANAHIDHPTRRCYDLEGGWDFAIGWTPKRDAARRPRGSDLRICSGSGRPERNSGSFEAVEKDLGLELVKQKEEVTGEEKRELQGRS